MTVTAAPEVPSPSPEEWFDVTLVPATSEPTDTAAPPIAPGRVFAFITDVMPGGANLSKYAGDVTYYEAQFLTGDAAKTAAAADNQDLESDFYIRNQSNRLRTVEFT